MHNFINSPRSVIVKIMSKTAAKYDKIKTCRPSFFENRLEIRTKARFFTGKSLFRSGYPHSAWEIHCGKARKAVNVYLLDICVNLNSD